MAQSVQQALRVTQVHKAHKEHRVPMAPPGQQAHKAQQVCLERRVLMARTATMA